MSETTTSVVVCLQREDCLIRAAEMGNIPIIEILAADMINLNAVRNVSYVPSALHATWTALCKDFI